MNLLDLFARITLDTDEYERGLDEAADLSDKAGSAVANAWSKEVSSALKSAGAASETLQNKIKVLGAQYEAAQDRVAELEAAFNKSVQETGATSAETAKLAQKLKEAESQAGRLKRELDGLSEEAKQFQKNSESATKETFSLAGALKTGLSAAAKGSVSALKLAGSAALSLGKALGEGLVKAAKMGAAALAAAEAAIAAFVKSSVSVGMEFDSAMSQVAATMGVTVDEVQALRDFAMEMGAKTAFSATEAAEALNYMALAGYDAETSMAMLPNVLNLAAAGGIDLAAASDMVTDAQSALGLSLDETTELVDKMAMASSKSNTSVAQMGEALLTIGGTGKNLAGGTTELATALGILADNGVKGAEGGTALRNIVLSLSAPTDKAAKSLENLNVKVYDAQGNMRPLNDIFNDLNGTLSTMTQGEQTQVLSEIFNKVDLKSVNALLANSGARFDELSGYIAQAQGSAEKMANTQLDNLAGDITLFKSALEGAQIVISDRLMPTLRGFVQFGTDGIGQLATAFQEGGFSGLMEALGGVLSDGLAMITEKIPQAVEAGMSLLSAFGQGISDNLPLLIDTALEIISMLLTGIAEGAPALAAGAAGIIASLTEGLLEALPEILSTAVVLIQSLADGIADSVQILAPAAASAIVQFASALLGSDTLGNLANAALEIIVALHNALAEALPELIPAAVDAILQIVDTLTDPDNLSNLIDAALAIILGLADGLIEVLPSLLAALPKIVQNIVTGLIENAPKLQNAALELITTLGVGLLEAVVNLPVYLYEVVTAIVNGFKEGYERLKGAGKYLLEGLWNGISDKVQWLKDKVSGVVDRIKGWFTGKSGFDEHSPSRWAHQVGAMVSEGLANGVEEKADKAKQNAEKMAKNVYSTLKTWAERETKLQELSLQDQIELWLEIQRQFKAGSEQFLQAEEKIFDLRQKLAKEQEQAEEQRKQKYEKILKEREAALKEYQGKVEQIHKEMESAQEEYQKTLESRTQQIFNSYGLFDELPQKQKVAGDQLILNLRGQVNQMEQFYTGLDKLAARGVGLDLVEEIRQMGPKAKDQLDALLAMSDDKLKEYAGLYAEKQKLASETATAELAGFLRETQEKIAQGNRQIKQLNDEYGPKIGLSLMDGMALGIKQGAGGLRQAVAQTMQGVYQSAVQAMNRLAGGMGYQTSIGGIKAGIVGQDILANPGLTQGAVEFGQSALGASSASLINSLAGAAGKAADASLTVNLNMDGRKLASALLDPLAKFAKANGTGIINVG